MAHPLTADLDSAIEAYEAARERDPGADLDLTQFTLPRSHPDYAPAIVELVRVDMEHTWRPADDSRVDRYRALFPDALSDEDALGAIAYEEYRLRLESGEQVDPDDYRRKHGCDVRHWGTQPPGELRSPNDSTHFQRVTGEPYPALGETIWDFELIDVLGEGAGGRVYLARQTRLANRLVVLKITREPSYESQQLAQLQHTNVVPIYSFHRRGELSGVCMPFLGRTTLAHWLAACRQQGGLPKSGQDLVTTIAARQDETCVTPSGTIVAHDSTADPTAAAKPQGWQHIAGQPYVDSVAWIGARLSEGLAHAHQKGIIHRDLKPANILLGEDGQPLLLDFHLSAQVECRNPNEVTFGGTIPYLAPECIEALGADHECLDPRSDIYALGVLLYEMLTGELPFPVHRGSLETVAPLMLEDRRPTAPSPRLRNRAVSPGLASIVTRCLAYEPQGRYASAQELQEDLQRHLEHRPLRFARDRSLVERAGKWAWRHPRLSSATTIGLVAVLVLAVVASSWVIRGEQLAAARFREQFHQFRQEAGYAAAILDIPGVDDQSLNAAVSRAEAALSQYAITSSPDWKRRDAVAVLSESDRDQLVDEVASLLYLLAAGKGQQAVRCDAAAERQRLLAAAFEANRLGQATITERIVPYAFRLQESRLLAVQQGSEAMKGEKLAAPEVPNRFEDRYLLAVELAHRRRYEDAFALLEGLVCQRPQDAKLWLGLGVCCYELGQYADAKGHFGTCIALRPELVLAHVYRAASRLKLRDYKGALADCNAAIALNPALPAAYFNRALAQDGLDQRKAAIDDLTQALDAGSTETRLYFLRSQWKRSLGDADGAAADRTTGLRMTPRDELSFVARGLARLDESPDGALTDFRDALRLNPASRSALQNLAVLHGEKQSRPELAIDALNRLVEVVPNDASVVASRGVYHARAGHRDAALQDAAAALKLDGEPMTHYRVGCIYARTSRSEPTDVSRAVAAVAEALKKAPALSALAATDSDLELIQENARFQSLLMSARQLQTATDPQTAHAGR